MTNVLKKLIGYGYTDSNGIATLDYTEDGTDITTLQPTGETGYIGNGVGSVQVGAEIHDNSILVSEPYPVLDCIKYDGGTTSNHNDVWTTTSAIEMTRKEEYTELKEATALDWNSQYLNQALTPNTRIEFDVRVIDGVTTDFFWGLSKTLTSGYINGGSIAYMGVGLNTWLHCILDIGETSAIMTGYNGSTRTFTYDAITSCYFEFWCSRNISEIHFKNFKVYPKP